MADYTVSTNLISWIPAQHGEFGWPAGGREAEMIRGMKVGDVIVPKFAQYPVHEGQEPYQRRIAAVYHPGEDPNAYYVHYRQQYETIVAWGEGAVPFLMRVGRQLGDLPKFPSNEPWACVSVELEPLEYPLSTSEYLHLRAVPVEIAGQFKAMAAPNRHIQPLPEGAGKTIAAAGRLPHRSADFLRRETLVRAGSSDEALRTLLVNDLGPIPFDRAFVVSDTHITGLHVCNTNGTFRSTGESIAIAPGELRPLFEEAQRKSTGKDAFRPARALAAANQIAEFLAGDEDVLPIAELAHFHDRYVILPRKVTEALELARRPEPTLSLEQAPSAPLGDVAPLTDPDDADEPEAIEVVTLEQLQGLSVEAVQAEIPDGMVIPRSVLAEAVTAVRSDKHLIFSGPPGTGKSTIAAALCRAVVNDSYRLATATADWTTFDTIGGYLPTASSALAFEPGIVLQCLKAAEWLIIDELNRADIDKAFGPLFTLLAGSGSAQETVLLPYRHAGKHIEIAWADAPGAGSADYVITKVWRLLGTMNVTDKAALFQLSFAFLRRFAVIDVPLPDEPSYRKLFAGALSELPDGADEMITDAAMRIAFGPVPLGPAILLDIAAFTRRGLIEASTGTAPYDEPLRAFLTAVRLYAVPQYEGTESAHVTELLDLIREIVPEPPADAWAALTTALDRVVL